MRCSLLVGIFLAFAGLAWALTADATREQVIEELGKPTSVAKLGAREILIYPKGVRVELEGGRIVAAKGITLSEEVTPPLAPAEKTAGGAGPDANADGNEMKKIAEENAAAEQEFLPGQAPGQSDIEKAVDGLMKSHDAAQQPLAPKAFDVLGFFLEAGLKLLLTVAALKLACKYWGAEVFWSAILTVAGVDTVVRGSMGLIGELLLGFPTLFYADEAVATVVMVLLLKKLSVNHSISQAIELSLTTKTFSVVVGSFLVTVLLRVLH